MMSKVNDNCNVGIFVGRLISVNPDIERDGYVCQLEVPYNGSKIDTIKFYVSSDVYEPNEDEDVKPIVFVRGTVRSERLENPNSDRSIWDNYLDATEVTELASSGEVGPNFRYLNRVYVCCKTYKANSHETANKHIVCKMSSNLLGEGNKKDRLTLIFWDSSAEAICQHNPGSIIRICGKLESRGWISDSVTGQSTRVTECTVSSFEVLQEGPEENRK